MITAADPSDVRLVFRGVTADFLLDQTRHVDLEGAFRSGKTTVALFKVLQSCLDHPGIQWFICRYADGDTQSKLKPAWRSLCTLTGTTVTWDPHALCDVLTNGSRLFIFGLKAQDQRARYSKLRGMTLAGVYVDQAEELPSDVYDELMGRLSQPSMPHQLLLTPNPPDENHWLATTFPEDNRYRDRHYYAVSIYDNALNLPAETITALERAYPLSHPKHRPAILGRRGLNVIGRPVYGGDEARGLVPQFVRALHERPLTMNPNLPLCEGLDFGKHHPCVVWAQFTPYGGVQFLGGLLGQDLFLQDFAAVVQTYRARWFPEPMEVWTCCDPAGSHASSQGLAENGVQILRGLGFHPRYVENANHPAIRLAMIERLGGYMRRRTAIGEAFGVQRQDPADPRWLVVSASGIRPWSFLVDGFEAGYVWDAHMVSVGSKQMRKPVKDGWYEHGQNCAEYLELSFGGAQQSVAQLERHAASQHRAALKRAQQDADPYDQRHPRGLGRGGY